MQEIPKSVQATVVGVEEEINVRAAAESKRGERGADRFTIWKKSKRFDTKCYQTEKRGICK
jgi:hypothetical protein